MNFLLLLIVLVLVVSFVPEAENSHIQFRANPSAIHPILTTTFQLRCSLQDYPWIKEATNAGVSANPFLKYTLDNSYYTSSPYWADTTSPYYFQTTETARPPTINTVSADVAHVTSIIIIKLSEYGQRQDVASVSLFDAAISGGYLASQAKVEGSCERSPVAGEQGYLTVTWSRPLQDQSGQYICEISGLGGDRHPVTLQSNLQITFSQPTLTDLISYISDNAMKISHLENEIVNLNSSSSNKTSLENLKAQNIQTGSGECYYSGTESVWFPHPYKSAPTLFISITNFTTSYMNSYEQLGGSVSIESVNYWGFYARCHLNSYTTLAYEWMAIDN